MNESKVQPQLKWGEITRKFPHYRFLESAYLLCYSVVPLPLILPLVTEDYLYSLALSMLSGAFGLALLWHINPYKRKDLMKKCILTTVVLILLNYNLSWIAASDMHYRSRPTGSPMFTVNNGGCNGYNFTFGTIYEGGSTRGFKEFSGEGELPTIRIDTKVELGLAELHYKSVVGFVNSGCTGDKHTAQLIFSYENPEFVNVSDVLSSIMLSSPRFFWMLCYLSVIMFINETGLQDTLALSVSLAAITATDLSYERTLFNGNVLILIVASLSSSYHSHFPMMPLFMKRYWILKSLKNENNCLRKILVSQGKTLSIKVYKRHIAEGKLKISRELFLTLYGSGVFMKRREEFNFLERIMLFFSNKQLNVLEGDFLYELFEHQGWTKDFELFKKYFNAQSGSRKVFRKNCKEAEISSSTKFQRLNAYIHLHVTGKQTDFTRLFNTSKIAFNYEEKVKSQPKIVTESYGVDEVVIEEDEYKLKLPSYRVNTKKTLYKDNLCLRNCAEEMFMQNTYKKYRPTLKKVSENTILKEEVRLNSKKRKMEHKLRRAEKVHDKKYYLRKKYQETLEHLDVVSHLKESRNIKSKAKKFGKVRWIQMEHLDRPKINDFTGEIWSKRTWHFSKGKNTTAKIRPAKTVEKTEVRHLGTQSIIIKKDKYKKMMAPQVISIDKFESVPELHEKAKKILDFIEQQESYTMDFWNMRDGELTKYVRTLCS